MQPLPITIPNPCHENWNDMTPDEKGRFCGKCCKTVIDFSAKTNDEILSILKTKQDERVCGHFNADQVNQPAMLTISLLQNGQPLGFRKIFFLSLFIAFGTTLFSCRDEHNRVLSKIEIVNQPEKEKQVTMGMIMLPPDDTLKKPHQEYSLKGETSCNPFITVNGGIPALTLTGEPDVPPVSIMGDTIAIIEKDTLQPMVTTGIFASSETPDTSVATIDTFMIAQLQKESEPFQNKTNFTVYPNPGKNIFTLVFNAFEKQSWQIALYDERGGRVQKFYTAYHAKEGTQLLQLTIEQPSGIYFVACSNGVNRMLQKIVIEN